MTMISMPFIESYMEKRRGSVGPHIAGCGGGSVVTGPGGGPVVAGCGGGSVIVKRGSEVRELSPLVVLRGPLQRNNSASCMAPSNGVKRSQSMAPAVRDLRSRSLLDQRLAPDQVNSNSPTSREQAVTFVATSKARVLSPRGVSRFVTNQTQRPMASSPVRPAVQVPNSPGRGPTCPASPGRGSEAMRHHGSEAIQPMSPTLGYRSPQSPSPNSPWPVSSSCPTCELQIGQQPFEPNHPAMKSMLLARLGVGPHSTIECHSSNHGGLNDGVWTVKDPAQPSQNLVLKLVSAQRGEGEIFSTLARQHPGICFDPLLTFPYVVFNCMGATGEKRYDLVVMRRAPGISVAEFIAQKHFTKQTSEIMKVLTKIGSCLREFHARYHDAQHGDFQTSNIFYEEANDKVTFIDFAGMGAKARYSQSDVEFFVNSLRICATIYGSHLLAEGARHFEAGYRMQKA
mmetsp:Transcript_81668/g.142013  ORF Transcript_81668/g.142013 Transcript_81668/m.142013 type:complete len:456 (-) Transcript_81668:146-1513(-)